MVAISKEEEVQKISTSIFVTNFPDHAKAKDLWNVCKQYGQVVDAFIPDRKSKAEANSNNGRRTDKRSYVNVVNGDTKSTEACEPALLLDESCLNQLDYSLGIWEDAAKMGERFSVRSKRKSLGGFPDFDETRGSNSESKEGAIRRSWCVIRMSMGNNEGSGSGNEKGESASIGSRKNNKIEIKRTGGSLLTVMEDDQGGKDGWDYNMDRMYEKILKK
ncbi:DIE2/ALG10 family protein [Tanacetum coccineum]